ncbi:MAG: TVP38/TMEM64 family protein [Candidatus Cellulosilyticum pullistercoris]|uniref:TVP38/TMEM64 family membrane protein n=1 Tax=Candidatus Cellulosilyticum pullistercoris TaxID=2838521 RepID=A0A9E2KEW5_9FIRM|nr:TVP38/TMEM64 family protein [Candidatus Cellulosilyticum pullistercoris]
MNTIKKNVKNMIHILSACGMIATLIAMYFAYEHGLFTSAEKLKAFVDAIGIWGPITFILLQLIQVVVPIIPGGITCVAGIIIFGPFWGFIYNYIGIVLGSLINFALARYYGQTLIRTLVSDKVYTKYASWLSQGERFDKLFALAIFFPVAPDDFLCMLAGLTRMTYRKFTTIIVLGKPASLLIYSLGLTSIFDLILKFIPTT